MNTIKNWIFAGFTLSLLAFYDGGHSPYPQDYFRAPVDGVIRLSGTFGELRPNHFHSGIDIKPINKKAGQPVYAAADGYVERIKVKATGYGRAIYLRHPNGYSTVYAHLQKFNPSLQQYVKSNQYRNKSFYVNLYPSPQKFSFKKGDIIGYLGNSGSSSGAHLHFEIRYAKTGVPVNPLLFGFDVKDNIPPRLHQLKVYGLNDKLETLLTKTINLSRNRSHYAVPGDTLQVGAWRVGFAVKAYDHFDGVSNWNGIYSMQLSANDSLLYSFEMEKFSFAETRYINAHLDYAEQVARKSYFSRCYSLPGNKLSIYNKKNTSGVIPLFKNKPTKITIETADVAGNVSILEFWIKRKTISAPPGPNHWHYDYVLPHDEQSVIQEKGMIAYFPKGTFYENCYFKMNVVKENSAGYYSPVYKLHDFKTPAHRYYTLKIKPDKPLPDSLRSKAFLAYCDNNNTITNSGGNWKGAWLTGRVRQLGDYCIMVDNEAPAIEARNFKEDMRGETEMTFLIKDNFKTSGKASGLRYEARVDGQWILMEYDAKYDLLLHRFDERIGPGRHQLRVEVRDDRNNIAVFNAQFLR